MNTNCKERHTRDENCIIDYGTNECTVCHAVHGDPCGHCGGTAYHKEVCPELRHETCTRCGTYAPGKVEDMK